MFARVLKTYLYTCLYAFHTQNSHSAYLYLYMYVCIWCLCILCVSHDSSLVLINESIESNFFSAILKKIWVYGRVTKMQLVFNKIHYLSMEIHSNFDDSLFSMRLDTIWTLFYEFFCWIFEQNTYNYLAGLQSVCVNEMILYIRVLSKWLEAGESALDGQCVYYAMLRLVGQRLYT